MSKNTRIPGHLHSHTFLLSNHLRLYEKDLLLPRIMAMPGITGIPEIPDITGILRICETRQPLKPQGFYNSPPASNYQ